MAATLAGTIPFPADETTVLVIDDQAVHREILREVITGIDPRIVVATIADCRAAAEWAARNVADLVLVDYQMPELNGIELVRLLRAMPSYRHVPIIMVTASRDPELRCTALDAGITDFLTKPVGARECRARCRNLITLRRQQIELERRGRVAAGRRARAEKGLRERESELRLIAEHVPAAVTYWDRDLRCRYANQAYLDLSGLSLVQVLGQHIAEVSGAAAWPLMEPSFRQALAGEAADYQRWFARAGEDARHVTVRVVPHLDSEGGVLGCYGMAIDTTADKHSLAELERLVAERTEALEAANRELSSFSYTVSHDLRAPLRHIAGHLEMLVKQTAAGQDAQAAPLIARAQASAQRLAQMIDALLHHAQLGRQDLSLAKVDLQAMVGTLREELSPPRAARRVEWTVGLLPEVHADPTLLRLALQNLLENALKYSSARDPARIDVTAHGDAASVTLCVRDNGAGFDMQYADKLFGTFSRLHSQAEFPGNGIGLAHVKRIVERHGGSIRADAAPGQGAAFYLTLPR